GRLPFGQDNRAIGAKQCVEEFGAEEPATGADGVELDRAPGQLKPAEVFVPVGCSRLRIHARAFWIEQEELQTCVATARLHYGSRCFRPAKLLSQRFQYLVRKMSSGTLHDDVQLGAGPSFSGLPACSLRALLACAFRALLIGLRERSNGRCSEVLDDELPAGHWPSDTVDLQLASLLKGAHQRVAGRGIGTRGNWLRAVRRGEAEASQHRAVFTGAPAHLRGGALLVASQPTVDIVA